ncbi:MAG: gliding motility protein GldM [Flavobacteriales bacterium]|nr:gliding motility protein GldM [Flavobacteriales bacterium]MCB9181010.1 gliding motility protein GldM [Flavobacteriales bacterium]HOP42460.1 gliding motility protein GldM [Flavobacteriales bacterium]HPF67128.1 gliding motility protein GldM [Flavobacteriales bacterium]HPQ58471.1 gliding motility protein GldM [Flavobacteriales bacterium]
MASGKLSPRQKMINMMYLVLTALLALNVSKEILDSFVTVNNGLENTKATLKEKMDETYGTFAQYASENQAKYGTSYAAAQGIQTSASELITYIDQIKGEVIAKTEGYESVDQAYANDTVINLKYIEKKDNYDVITEVMIGPEPATPKEGEFTARDLRTRLEAFRDKLKQAAGNNEVLIASIDQTFSFPDEKEAGDTGPKTSWESKNFYHVPLAAGVTILSKLQGDIRNMENETVNHLLGSVEQKSFKFNTLTPIVKPLSSYVTVGGKYQADIFMGAYDNQNPPEVYICGPGATIDTLKKEIVGEAIKLPMDGAMAKLEQGAARAGLNTVRGIIKFKPVGGEAETRIFETVYEVAQPNLVVSPSKMNVFYRGVDNPVTISVSGFSDKDIQPSVSNGSLSKGGEGWVVRPGKDRECIVTATVTNPDGSKKTMQGNPFRVKNVPNPTPYFAGKSVDDETIKKAELTASQGVIAKMVDFEFDLRFEVVEFKVTMIVSGTPIEKYTKGPALSGEMKEMFQKAKPGQKVYIEGIKAKGPDGTIRSLGSLSFKVV